MLATHKWIFPVTYFGEVEMKSKIFGFLAVCYIVFALVQASTLSAKTYRQGWIPPDNVDVITIDKATHLKKLEPNCVVLWTAKWCASCKKMKPVIKQLSEEGYAVHVLDYDENRKDAKRMDIRTLPTVIIRENGKEVARHVKVVSKNKILKTLKKNKTEYEIF
jgi:thioredoxin 1